MQPNLSFNPTVFKLTFEYKLETTKEYSVRTSGIQPQKAWNLKIYKRPTIAPKSRTIRKRLYIEECKITEKKHKFE